MNTATPPIAPRYASYEQAGRYCGLSPRTIRKLIEQGRLRRYHPVPGRTVVDLHELDRLILASSNAPESPALAQSPAP
jgi:excisionase family DNA binding protein